MMTTTAKEHPAAYEKIEIRQGMRKEHVEERFGSPEITKDTGRDLLGVSRERALYRIGETDHMILDFYAKRVSGIEILSGMNNRQAEAVFTGEDKEGIAE